MLLTVGVWLAAVLLVVGVCTWVAPAVTDGHWWTMGFCIAPTIAVGDWSAPGFVATADACTPGGEGWGLVGFNAADSAAATGTEVFTPPIAAGVGNCIYMYNS